VSKAHRVIAVTLTALVAFTAGCNRHPFPDVPAGYHEFAYVSNGTANTVTVLDLVYLRRDRTLQVGQNPTGLAVNPAGSNDKEKANPRRNEVYVVNTGSGSISVIDALTNRVVGTIPVHRQPYFISVDATGHRAYVANSGSNNVSILDLDKRREIGVLGAGEQPGLARISPDMRSLVVTNRVSGSVSIFGLTPWPEAPAAHLRVAYPGCPGATDAVILPDSSRAFIACSGNHQVMAVNLAAASDTWAAKQDPSLTSDHLLALLDVGKTPVHLAMKPDGGEIFVSNYDSDSISEIATSTAEVGGTYTIGSHPVHAVVSSDNSVLWVSNFGADSIALYSIDDGKLSGSVRTGSGPDSLAFSADEHLLLAADAHSGDVSVIRTQSNAGPALFTILPGGGAPNALVTTSFNVK
jgi:YVTN family beta-propeller protein